MPPHVSGDLEVFLNGVPQAEGRDYRREGNTLVFERPLAKEGRLGMVRWLSMLLGAYTTFSTLSLESYRLLEDRAYGVAAANLFGSLAAGLVAVYAGVVVGRAI